MCKTVHTIGSVWCKMALGEVGVSLPWWCPALVFPSTGSWGLFLHLKAFSLLENYHFQKYFRSKLKLLDLKKVFSNLKPGGQGGGIIMGVTRLFLLGPFYYIQTNFSILFCTWLYDIFSWYLLTANEWIFFFVFYQNASLILPSVRIYHPHKFHHSLPRE